MQRCLDSFFGQNCFECWPKFNVATRKLHLDRIYIENDGGVAVVYYVQGEKVRIVLDKCCIRHNLSKYITLGLKIATIKYMISTLSLITVWPKHH